MTEDTSASPESVPQPEYQSEAVTLVETLAPTSAEVREPEPVPAPESSPMGEHEVADIPSPVELEPQTTETSPPTPTKSQQSQQSPPPAPAAPSIATHRAAALLKRRANKEERLEKVVALARVRGTITNNDVQILLGVSHATATRYLVELARTGRLTRVGKQKRPEYKLG